MDLHARILERIEHEHGDLLARVPAYRATVTRESVEMPEEVAR